VTAPPPPPPFPLNALEIKLPIPIIAAPTPVKSADPARAFPTKGILATKPVMTLPISAASFTKPPFKAVPMIGISFVFARSNNFGRRTGPIYLSANVLIPNVASPFRRPPRKLPPPPCCPCCSYLNLNLTAIRHD
jgi:hypothetical protein